ncbi:MAG: fasciclin domain-containing protein [Phycisphaeraceae bacterium]|nr:MAG: fasciclin domain-containing protein [Phycisphaeraceae bacterium]
MLKAIFTIGLTALAAPALAGTCGSAATAKACAAECSQQVQTVAANYQRARDIVDTAVNAGNFTILARALTEAGLVETLKGDGPFTVFAPTDEAFAKLPDGTLETLLRPENRAKLTAILTYHVVPGNVMAADVVKLDNATTVNGQRVAIKVNDGKVMIDGATVTTTDIRASNGVIHVIDSVILPVTDTIPSVAQSADQFATLLAAVKAAGLDRTLSGEGPFTVFAPTDEAFAKLPAGTVENLLKPENRDQLVKILTYHVVPGRVYSDQVVKLEKAKTVQGGELTIANRYGKVRINDATVIAADIQASNGVIHVIDTVMLPR